MLTSEQIATRRKTMGASDAPIILGISPWSNEHDIWMSKQGMDVTNESQAMRLGNYLQRGIAMEAINQVGGSIIADDPHAVHANGWASATPDCIIRQDERNVILEIKCTHEKAWDVVPEHYILQVHWQCWVHGIDQAYIAVLHGSSQVKVYEINIDLKSDWFSDCVTKCKKWWDTHIILGVEPVWGRGPANEPIKKAIRAAAGTSVEIDDALLGVLSRCVELKSEISWREEELKTLETAVKETLDSREIGIRDGKTLVTWKETTSKTFDSSAFKKAEPLVAAKYQKESVSRRYLLKDDAITSYTGVTA